MFFCLALQLSLLVVVVFVSSRPRMDVANFASDRLSTLEVSDIALKYAIYCTAKCQAAL